MKSAIKYILPLLSIGFLFISTGCNKDEVIEIEPPENPENPNNPGSPENPDNPDNPLGPDQPSQRPVTPESSNFIDAVFEWTPAPGQFINDFGTDFADASAITKEDAAQWAYQRLLKRNFVSLGAFGGYIVAGFDHSISNTGGFEIGIFGNAFLSANGSSDEPGIVYVMKDENGNGLPDDTWYELKGSDTFAPGTIRNYQITYFRPSGDGQPVAWKDNLGNSGEIPYLGAFHKQPTYYPYWVTSDSYTLSGTLLEAKTNKNPETGFWENPPFEWGYADNIGEDNIELDGIPNCNRFRISDAIDEEGNSVDLDYIDFVKVQTGVSAVAGWLGEVSTEVLGIIDLTLTQNR